MPQIWRLNKEQVKNPHWIYPGNLIVLDRSGGDPRLRLGKAVGNPTIKLSPRVRSGVELLGAIPSIPNGVIEPFLSQPLVVEPGGLDASARIVAAQEDRVYLGSGDRAYAIGLPANAQALWQIYRPGRPLVDPDSKEVLGLEAIYVGTGKVLRDGRPATVEIVTSAMEVGIGDRMLPAEPLAMINYAPHAPEKDIKGRVIGVYGGVGEAGRNSIVSISRGLRDGVERGHVLALYRRGETVKLERGQPAVKMPDERYGLAFVFRAFSRVSYALVLDVSRPVTLGDSAQTP